MATIVKDLGAVTAYAYAVEKGYTGTEDEFAELMASYADVAEQAAESAAQAGASATAAEQAKAEAVLSASAAASSASTASTKASEAASSASSAAGSANTATTKANEASTSATNAASSASSAATSATNAGASETAAASSATAASNAQTAAETAQGKAEDAQTAAEDAAEQAGIYAAGYLKAFPVDTASGAVANFSDGADELPVKDLTVDIEPVQSGSGDPSPDNVRPISGWTGANVTRTGKNLLNQNITWTTGTRDDNGNIISGASHFTNAIYGIKPNTEYTISGTLNVATTDAHRIYFLKADGTWISRTGTSAQSPHTFTTPSECGAIQIQVTGALTELSDVQLELGSTATAYEAYFGDTYSITFPSEAGTVYGGTLDVTTGKLTVDRAGALLNAPDKWMLASGGQTIDFYYDLSFSDRKLFANSYTGLICSYMQVRTGASQTARWQGANLYRFGLHDSTLTLEQVKADAANGKISILYPLATPIVYDLTPTEVTTLLGTNNVWADTGDSIVEYRADPTLYINKKIAALAAAMN